MAARFVNIDRDTPMPPEMRDRVSGNHLVHFIRDAVSLLDLEIKADPHGLPEDAPFVEQMKRRQQTRASSTEDHRPERGCEAGNDALSLRGL